MRDQIDHIETFIVTIPRDTPVTVWSSPEPSWSRSSTWENGSRRAPKRDFVFRTPFAIAPIRPRSDEYRWRIRSASANRKDRSTTASVLRTRPTSPV